MKSVIKKNLKCNLVCNERHNEEAIKFIKAQIIKVDHLVNSEMKSETMKEMKFETKAVMKWGEKAKSVEECDEGVGAEVLLLLTVAIDVKGGGQLFGDDSGLPTFFCCFLRHPLRSLGLGSGMAHPEQQRCIIHSKLCACHYIRLNIK